MHLNENDKVLAYHRWDKGGHGDDVMVIINFANKTQSDYWLNFPAQGIWKVRFNSNWKGYSEDFENVATPDVTVDNDRGKVSLGPYSAVILSQDK
jgi:1,4-alpha-glucan branching enzyme